jgi:hypothetical protein
VHGGTRIAAASLALPLLAGPCAALRTAPEPTPPAPTPVTPRIPADLRNAMLPAGVCMPDAGPIMLKDGRGKGSSRQANAKYGSYTFYVGVGERVSAVRGNLVSGGGEEVALVVVCEGFGGGNYWKYHVVVMAPADVQPTLVAFLTPDDHGVGVGGAEVRLHGDRLRTTDRTYRPGDPRCCPTGYGYTEWRWDGERFVQSAAGTGRG